MNDNIDMKNKIPLMNMKLASFKLKYNSKCPSSEWMKCNLASARRNRTLEKMELLKDELNNFGVICGKANDLTIVDLDFYNHGDETFDPRMSQFIKEFGDFVKRFDTLTIKTGSGGFHLYFKYIQKIKQTSDRSSSIDIRNDGGYVVAPYSNINGKKYVVENLTDIKPMPQELSNWLLNNIYPTKKMKVVRNPKVKVIKINEETNIEEEVEEDFDNVDLGVYKFAVPKKIVEDCLCKGLPDKYFHDRHFWVKFTTAMKTLDMMDLWIKYSQKRCKVNYEFEQFSKDRDWLKQQWNYINRHNELDMLTHCLKQSKITNAIDILTYFKYKPTECHTELPTDFITREKLGYNAIEEFSENHKVVLFRSDTGTGKTTTMKHYLKTSGKRFISIVSRISLGEEQAQVFKNHGIDCEYHQVIQDAMDENNLKHPHDARHWHDYEGENIIITVDSLCKLNDFENFMGYTIYLDELNSLIEHLITSPTCSKKRSTIFYMIRKIIQDADLVIGTDADISDNCLELFKQLNIKYRFIDNQYKHNKGVKATEYCNFDKFMKKMMKEPKFILCADSKTIVDIMAHQTFKKTGGDVKVITSETSGRVNLDDYDRVLFSPKIVYGIDSVMKRPVFAYFCQQTITPVAMVQQLCRCRDIVSISFMFKDAGVKSYKYHDVGEIKEEVQAMDKLSLESYSCVEDLKEDYLDLYSRFEYNYDCYNTNKKAHFIQILKNRGVNMTLALGQESNDYGIKEGKEEVEEKREQMIITMCDTWKEKVVVPYLEEEDCNDITEPYERFIDTAKEYFPEWIWRKNEILKIPFGEIHKYMELFTKPAHLVKHLTLCNFFFKSDNELMQDMNDSKDYGIKKWKSQRGQLILMKKFISMTNCSGKDKYTIPPEEFITGLTDRDNEKYLTEYNLMYRTRRKEPEDLTDKHQAYLHYVRWYNHLLNVETKKTSKKGKSISVHSVDRNELDRHFKIMNFRSYTEPLPWHKQEEAFNFIED